MSNGPAAMRQHWGTRVGVVLAVAGSAVGLGNFLRFPGQAAENGGGIFMIPYIVSFILLGIPLAWAEWGIGRYGGRFGFNSSPAIFGALSRTRAWRGVGGLALLIPIGIYMYYVLIEAWCLGYAFDYAVGNIDLGDDPAAWVQRSGEHFNAFVGAAQDGMMLTGGDDAAVDTINLGGLHIHKSVVFWALVFGVNFFVIYHGVTRGIERFCIFVMPLMALAALIVLVRVLTLPPLVDPTTGETRGVLDGLGFMWNPKPTAEGQSAWMALLNPDVWLAAAGQIFFSLSVGFGIIVNYASYLRRNDDVALSGLTAASTNGFFEVCLGGLITIPAAFLFLGLARMQEAGIDSSFDLGFKTLPIVFEQMPAGRLFGFMWFFMLFLAAITSSVSMLQPAIAFLEEGLGLGRRASVAILGLITALGSGFVIYFSKGLVFLDTLDFWVGTALIFVLATLQAILFGWVFGAERAHKELQHGAALRVPAAWKFVIRYVSPSFLLIVFGFWCYKNVGKKWAELVDPENRVALGAVVLLLLILGFFLVLISVASQRWGDPKQHQPLAEDAA